jgi:hypothetical protein
MVGSHATILKDGRRLGQFGQSVVDVALRRDNGGVAQQVLDLRDRYTALGEPTGVLVTVMPSSA